MNLWTLLDLLIPLPNVVTLDKSLFLTFYCNLALLICLLGIGGDNLLGAQVMTSTKSDNIISCKSEKELGRLIGLNQKDNDVIFIIFF